MTYQNPPDSEIYEILKNARIVAMVGASSNPERPSHGVMKVLQRAGYKVIPVNPNETEILGARAYARLSDIPEKVDIVDVFRKPELTPEIAAGAVKIGAKVLWLQLGVVNDGAATLAKAGGLQVVMDKCMAIELRALNVPPVMA